MSHTFSAVLDSKKQVKNIILSGELNQKVFFEADIGQLVQVKFAEGIVLEVIGTTGVLRIDLPIEVLLKAVEKQRGSEQ